MQSGKRQPGLSLAGGGTYAFAPTDSHAREIVEVLARIARLPEAVPGALPVVVTTDLALWEGLGEYHDLLCLRWRKLGGEELRKLDLPPPVAQAVPAAGDAILCLLDPALRDEVAVEQKLLLLLRVAVADRFEDGAVMLHGALVSRNGRGVILAGRSGAGKTTASGRLPAPWEQHSDDTSIVLPDGEGRWHAHPFPSAGRVIGQGCTETWDVGRGVPLDGIFFIEQDSRDAAAPLGPGQAACLLVEAANQGGAHFTEYVPAEEKRLIRETVFASLCRLTAAVPQFHLRLTRSGPFWHELERALIVSNRRLHRGQSMEPILREGDLLEIESIDEKGPAVGDVIIFTPPGGEERIIHRVTGTAGDGFLTRGDNCEADDPWTLSAEAVEGRVTALSRGAGHVPVAGGAEGLRAMRANRRRKALDRGISSLVRPFYRGVARGGLFRPLLPPRLRPRVVSFGTNGDRTFRLLAGERVVGSWDPAHGRWRIRRPWLLFVDPAALGSPSAEKTG